MRRIVGMLRWRLIGPGRLCVGQAVLGNQPGRHFCDPLGAQNPGQQSANDERIDNDAPGKAAQKGMSDGAIVSHGGYWNQNSARAFVAQTNSIRQTSVGATFPAGEECGSGYLSNDDSKS
jgi:hypothetical protein